MTLYHYHAKLCFHDGTEASSEYGLIKRDQSISSTEDYKDAVNGIERSLRNAFTDLEQDLPFVLMNLSRLN